MIAKNIKSPQEKQLSMLIFLFFILIYICTAKGYLQVTDTGFSLKTANALLFHHSLLIEDKDKRGISPAGHENTNKFYSKYGIALAIIFIPYILAGKALAGLTGLPARDVIEFILSFYNVIFGALSCVLIYWLTLKFCDSHRIALLVALLFGLTTLAWRYSLSDFSEGTQTFLLLLVIYLLLKNTSQSILQSSLFCGFLILLKVFYIIFLPIFLAYIFVINKKNNRWSKVFIFVVVNAVSIVFLLWLNYYRYKNILEFGYGPERAYLQGIVNVFPLLFSLNKGLFIYSPILCFSIFGYVKFLKLYPKEAWFFLALISLNLFLSSIWHSWEGGWSWGPRLLVPMVPLYLIPICFLFPMRNVLTKSILAVFITISFLIQGMSVMGNYHEYLEIRYHLVEEKLREQMPADIVGQFIILKHKIFEGNTKYKGYEFGLRDNSTLDLGQKCNNALNFWSSRIAIEYNKPWLKYVPLILIPFIILLAYRLFSFILL